MTSTKHTAAPWKFTRDEGTGYYHEVFDAEGFRVCNLLDRRGEDNAANALLIAAAPELLECLKDLVDAESDSPIHKRALATIALATGEPGTGEAA